MPNNRELQAAIERINGLKRKKNQLSEELAEKKGDLKALQGERDKLHARCRELGVEPDDIRAEIERRMTALAADVDSMEGRMTSIGGGSDHGCH
jgi:predicted  nucleic acid-binding Zn-ribbon protein